MQAHGYVFENGQVVTPGRAEPASAVWVAGATIRAVGPAGSRWDGELINAAGCLILPGFIDIHTHGGDGADAMDATPAALERLSTFFARHGVTGFLATTLAASREAITAAVETIAQQMVRPLPGAALLGAHLEGPYLAPARAGAQPLAHIRPADPAEYRPWLASGAVKLITLAPEIAANRLLLTEAHRAGISVAVGHSEATYDEVLAAVALGLNGVTHTFNALPALHHRQPGALGAALTCDALYTQVIADRIHLHPAIVNLLVRAKTPARTVLITDSIRAAGLPDGDYDLGGERVQVRDGAARLPDGTLAGSTLTMDAAFRHVLEDTGVDLAAAAQMAALTPAAALGLAGRKGRVAPGYDADLVLLDAATLQVRLTMVGGFIVYPAEYATRNT